jgi:hypothetical protein
MSGVSYVHYCFGDRLRDLIGDHDFEFDGDGLIVGGFVAASPSRGTRTSELVNNRLADDEPMDTLREDRVSHLAQFLFQEHSFNLLHDGSPSANGRGHGWHILRHFNLIRSGINAMLTLARFARVDLL